MGAHDDATMTIDTSEMLYTDQNGVTSYVNNAETIVWDLIAAASSAEVYEPKSVPILDLADGRKLRVDMDRSHLQVNTDATARLNAGSLWVEEDNGYRAEWKCRTVTIDDIDEPTEFTATFERVDNPMVTMTLTTVTMSQMSLKQSFNDVDLDGRRIDSTAKESRSHEVQGDARFVGHRFILKTRGYGDKKCLYCGVWFHWTESIALHEGMKGNVDRMNNDDVLEPLHCGSSHCEEYHRLALIAKANRDANLERRMERTYQKLQQAGLAT